jgi:hypothetical protein
MNLILCLLIGFGQTLHNLTLPKLKKCTVNKKEEVSADQFMRNSKHRPSYI